MKKVWPKPRLPRIWNHLQCKRISRFVWYKNNTRNNVWKMIFFSKKTKLSNWMKNSEPNRWITRIPKKKWRIWAGIWIFTRLNSTDIAIISRIWRVSCRRPPIKTFYFKILSNNYKNKTCPCRMWASNKKVSCGSWIMTTLPRNNIRHYNKISKNRRIWRSKIWIKLSENCSLIWINKNSRMTITK